MVQQQPQPTPRPINETPLAAAAYAAYEQLGEDRSLDKLVAWYRVQGAKLQPITTKSNQNGRDGGTTAPPPTPLPRPYVPNVSTLKHWSQAHNWQARIFLHEQALLERRRKKREEQIERYDEEQTVIGRTQTLRAVAAIEKLIADNALTPTAAVRLLEVGVNIWRTASGAATMRTEMTGKDGGPVQVAGTVGFYQVELPAKQPTPPPPPIVPPMTTAASDDGTPPPPAQIALPQKGEVLP